MGTEIIRFDPPEAIPPPLAIAVEDLVEAFLAGRATTTIRAYRKDLDYFAAFLGCATASQAVERLIGGGPGQGNTAALGYRAHMTARGLAPATIARRLAALRSVVKLARTLGRATWTIDVASPRSEAYRDTRGPGLEGWRAMLAAARADRTPIGLRNLALARLLHDNALRRAEAAALDLADVDLAGMTIAIVGKGKRERSILTISPQTAAALADWIATRGPLPGRLFTRLDAGATPGKVQGIHPSTVAKISHRIGGRAGVARGTNPHGLRHQGVTRALDLAGGDVRRVRKFSRHASLDVLLRYDDNRRDEAGQITRMLGEDE